MNKLTKFSQEVHVDDQVKLYLNNGKEVSGLILEIAQDFVEIMVGSSRQTLYESMIGGWEIIESGFKIKEVNRTVLALTQSYKEYESKLNEDYVLFGNYSPVFAFKKMSKYDMDTTTKEINDVLLKCKSKYEFAVLNKDKSKLHEIHNSLSFLENDHILDPDIKWNKLLVSLKLEQNELIDGAIEGLLELNLNREQLLFVAYAKFVRKQYETTIQVLVKYLLEFGSYTEDVSNYNNLIFLLRMCSLANVFKNLYLRSENRKDENRSLYINSLLLLIDSINPDNLKPLIQLIANDLVEKKSVFENNFILSDLGNVTKKNIPELTVDENVFRAIPSNAVIYYIRKELNYGFIRDSYGNEAFFHFSEIIDHDLKTKIFQATNPVAIPVVCTIRKSDKGYKASTIQLPNKLSDVHKLIRIYMKAGDYVKCNDLLEQVLFADPEDKIALKFKDEIESNRISTISKYSTFFNRAIYEFNINKNQTKAIEYYEKSISANEPKKENSIKNLAMLYHQSGSVDKAIDLVESNIREIKNTDPYNLLSHLCETSRYYDKAIVYLNKIKTNSQQEKFKVLKRIAFCQFNLQRYQDAKNSIETALRIFPREEIALNLSNILESALKSGDFASLENYLTEFELFSAPSGISSIVMKALGKCKFDGMPEKEIEAKEFSYRGLENLRNLINKSTNNIPKQRAAWLLTEIKVVKEFNLDDEDKIYPLISRYFITMAQSSAIENDIESMRIYYAEHFKISRQMNYIIQPLIHYVLSFIMSWNEIQSTEYYGDIKLDDIKRFQRSGLADALDRVLLRSSKIDPMFWTSLVELSIYNNLIKSEIVKTLFSDKNFLEKTLIYLRSCGFQVSDDLSMDSFSSIWDSAIEKRKKEIKDWFLIVNSINKAGNIEEFVNLEPWLKLRSFWLIQRDTERFNSIVNDLLSEIREFLAHSYFDEKERQHRRISILIEQMLEDIEAKPSIYALEGFSSLLQKCQTLVNSAYMSFVESSKPKLIIGICGDSLAVNEQNIAELQISVLNEKYCSPVSGVNITIGENNQCELVDSHYPESSILRGGQEYICKFRIKLSDTVVKQKATSIDINCDYIDRIEEMKHRISESLSLKFYSSSEFKNIENTFAPIADSGPLQDPKMFYGRREFIENISNSILNSRTKCIIIYGQKRSGKSSVLYHLKKELEDSQKAICISFSLGLILEGLNSATFYYKILTSLKDYFSEKCPDLYNELNDVVMEEIEKNPSLKFEEYIRMYIKTISRYPQWKDNHIILLIDEFTYLYTSILKEKLSGDFMKTWKAIIELGYFSAVLVGQDVMPRFKSKFANEFGVTEDRRLTYINEIDARRLIDEPMWDKESNCSRFIGKAIDRVLDYTSSSPYYIPIFCSKLVEFMNQKKLIKLTDADIKEVANNLITGPQALTDDKFDNLLTSGDAEIEAIPQKHTYEILKRIAISSKNIGYCSKDVLPITPESLNIDDILEDLLKRDVIIKKQFDYYKILVKLFEEWLLFH